MELSDFRDNGTFSFRSGDQSWDRDPMMFYPAETTSDPSVNVTNTTSTPVYPPLFVTSPAAIAVPIIFVAIFVMGLVGNGTLVYTVARNKNLRNTPNILIVSLATGDLLLILVSVPFTATYFTFSYWPYGALICKLNEFMQTLSLGVSVFTLVALSGDRYMAIVYPMSKHKASPTIRISLIAGAIWLAALLLAVMDAIKAHVQINISDGHIYEYCQVQNDIPYARFRVMFRFSIYFLIPVITIATFYILMARILFQSSKNMLGDARNSQAARQMEARKKVAKVVLSFVVVFVVCWFPLYLYRIWYYFLPGDFNLFWYVFKFLSFCLAFANSCVNPFALYFLSKQFRRYYNRYLFCCCVRGAGGDHTGDTYQTTLYHFNNAGSRPTNSITMMTAVTSKTAC
ncbi:hypothetical protein LSH36_617g02002 [Paralvinella palmiformis]|uniref:G-protein coupled receptors family 1 profile domain-containing protein n=1 Tax=Paralvinella palmiformis TaxID=53620 RepID=A0AAD9MW46_9ANNE|nr:hypothetical protein LSH36_617g02002 [Paralvinella palmiformis]